MNHNETKQKEETSVQPNELALYCYYSYYINTIQGEFFYQTILIISKSIDFFSNF